MSNKLKFESTHILIVGDVMLDRYWHGVTSRISPEAPVPIVHVNQQQQCPGGAGNVALNIRALGGQVTVIGVTGKDEAADILSKQLTDQNINCAFIRLENAPTITKLRVLSRHQQLIRLDFENPFSKRDVQQIATKMQTYIDKVDAVILSDYGKGSLVDSATMIKCARMAGKPVLVDPKGNDFEKYRGATVITPNVAEFEAIVGHCSTETELVEKGQNLRQHLNLNALLITRSQDGMTLLRENFPALHLPTHAREVFDVTGAGDTVIATLATGLASGLNWESATKLANKAAGIVVSKLGAATVSLTELEPNRQTETVVMTNGCFDILHAGHIQYLTQARQLGDRLIVALNDDDSVRRLKGKTRPINSLEQRMTVLNALECVDEVIAFSDDTPEKLICQILPDILVKGGDYTIDQIAGSDCVLKNGGQVLTLDFVEGCSTSNIIERIGNNK
jgi:D-beta-D-heptose 7-phosphate kinase/D-beta-D-heptose 1-phosphate adenosyltransferase